MNKLIVFLLFFTPKYSIAQQESILKIDSGKGNDITVIQKGTDSGQISDIDLKHIDSNKIKIEQLKQDSIAERDEPRAGIWNSIDRTNVILSIAASLIAIVIFIAGIKKFKRKK